MGFRPELKRFCRVQRICLPCQHDEAPRVRDCGGDGGGVVRRIRPRLDHLSDLDGLDRERYGACARARVSRRADAHPLLHLLAPRQNTNGQWVIDDDVDSPAECIALAQAHGCDIANVNEGGTGSCWCQYGSEGGTDWSGWMACWLHTDPVEYLEDWEYTEEQWDGANDCCFYRYAYDHSDTGCCDGMSCTYSNSMYSWDDWRRRLSESGGESVEHDAHRALGHCCDEGGWCSCMHNYIANGIDECEGDDAWKATASSGCSRATDGSACTSENGDGGYDCWAGSEHEECTCGNGLKARETGNQLEWDGETYYEYECCQPGTEGTVGEECGDCCVDYESILIAIIGGVVGGVVFLICCAIAICYVAKCACFAKNVASVAVAPPVATIEMATPMQPMVALQPQNAKSGSFSTSTQLQVLQPQGVTQPQVLQPQMLQPQNVTQPQVLQPQGVTQPQVLVPQQGSVRTTQMLVPQQGSL